ncbi:hypothetical protein Tco_0437980 [Tanacetum coccineum]
MHNRCPEPRDQIKSSLGHIPFQALGLTSLSVHKLSIKSPTLIYYDICQNIKSDIFSITDDVWKFLLLNPFGYVKLTTFVVMCKAYGCEPSVDLFRGFVNLFPGGQWTSLCLLSIESSYPKIIGHGQQNFMYAENDEDLSFLPKEPSLDFGTGSPSVSINTKPPVVRAEPMEQLVENTANSGDSSVCLEKLVIHSGSVAARIKDRKCRTRGSSKPPSKRRLVQASSSSRDTRQKTSPPKADSPFHTIFDDEEGLPDVLKLQDANVCHLKISNITHPA